MPNLGPTELLIILVLVVVLFGAARLPKLARSLGEAQRELRNGLRQPAEGADADG
jgi:sec-independent protein translocase protein TatA